MTFELVAWPPIGRTAGRLPEVACPTAEKPGERSAHGAPKRPLARGDGSGRGGSSVHRRWMATSMVRRDRAPGSVPGRPLPRGAGGAPRTGSAARELPAGGGCDMRSLSTKTATERADPRPVFPRRTLPRTNRPHGSRAFIASAYQGTCQVQLPAPFSSPMKPFALFFASLALGSVAALTAACSPARQHAPSPPAPDAAEERCTTEAKVCPDGSGVGRTGPHCAFAPCPGAGAIDGGPAPQGPQRACTEEAKVCPGGSTVGRTGPNCTFALCPPIGGGSEPGGWSGNCKNQCGNGNCEEVVCQAFGCPCSESKASCPQDCR